MARGMIYRIYQSESFDVWSHGRGTMVTIIHSASQKAHTFQDAAADDIKDVLAEVAEVDDTVLTDFYIRRFFDPYAGIA